VLAFYSFLKKTHTTHTYPTPLPRIKNPAPTLTDTSHTHPPPQKTQNTHIPLRVLARRAIRRLQVRLLPPRARQPLPKALQFPPRPFQLPPQPVPLALEPRELRLFFGGGLGF
jgi:hypothetical protein